MAIYVLLLSEGFYTDVHSSLVGSGGDVQRCEVEGVVGQPV